MATGQTIERLHGGQRISTLDPLGSGFSLLTGKSGARWLAAAASASAILGVAITVHRIGTDADVVDPEGRWETITGLRPDGFVGWRADTLPADPGNELRQPLSAILSR